jgi:transposase-like protein
MRPEHSSRVPEVGQRPKQVSTDGHTPYPRAIEETLGKRVEHRIMCGLGNPIEQDHRGIQPRYYPTPGCKVSKTAAGFCRGYDEVRNYSRPRQKMGQEISLGRRRQLFIGRFLKLQGQFCGV